MITVVGIGADGWDGLPERVRSVVAAADVVVGGARHLGMIPSVDVRKVSWPKPFRDGLSELFERLRGRRVVVLASGDPLVSGVGTTLVDLLGSDGVRVLPAVSSVALARARLGWAAERCETVSVVGRNVHRVSRALAPGRRLLVLSSDAGTPTALAVVLAERGYGRSRMIVLENLGGKEERRVDGIAGRWAEPPGAALNVVAIDCRLDPSARSLAASPGLPDDAFDHDGQLTKRDLRASALGRLAPMPGQLLWDVGAGSGSVAIEWMRVHPANRAVAIEADPARAARIGRNAERLGVPDLRVVTGTAPDALGGLEPDVTKPDAIFVGGGVSREGVLPACVAALATGGRLVAHAVTLEAEMALARAYESHGGELTRHSVERASPLGGFTGWQPARTLTQWNLIKEST
ncbi:precorrin-6y C5,15-methyltransferase (decarboxylating) subunit CbiE [Phytoactinopolyspora alkaliphila]|uniref:Precorrin-6y C5,15-methyltransferase (Decarboxylating) subunit CbiE n=1 Tax=Phytoactinopolyspora alkaliphila TaxID=1783498 RepID=A0A6N9YKU2_9ACTN|nr:precorrin-6y C5,15-methyltransferase (decarboxylating) subunit CbiE [Phytoactinopolyspora alkaliphila]NED95540.1 precorrin-6y C5,15-methyltransferase (decarboxylating) subunit CbiE [Phytoactinopolyspora alkaliphila]